MNFCNLGKDEKNQKNKPGPTVESGNEDDDSSFKIKTVAQKKAEKKERERKNGMKKRQNCGS